MKLSHSIWDYVSLYMDINENKKDESTIPSSLFFYHQANEEPLVSVDQSKRRIKFLSQEPSPHLRSDQEEKNQAQPHSISLSTSLSPISSTACIKPKENELASWTFRRTNVKHKHYEARDGTPMISVRKR
jgi:hypothetical protein